MDNNLNTYTVSETVQKNFSDFLGKLLNIMPSSFSLEEAVLKPRKNCSEVYIPMLKQAWMEDFVDELESKLNVNILYASVKPDGKDYRVIAYSMPYLDKMYIIQIKSNQFGIVNGMSVAFYDSMEKMFEDIRYYKQLLRISDAEVLEEEDERTTISRFL
jgi:hypothetical protein